MNIAGAIGSEIIASDHLHPGNQSPSNADAARGGAEDARFNREIDVNIYTLNLAVQLLIDHMLTARRTGPTKKKALEEIRYNEAKLQRVIGEAAINMTNETVKKRVASVSSRISLAVKHAKNALEKLLIGLPLENISPQQVA